MKSDQSGIFPEEELTRSPGACHFGSQPSNSGQENIDPQGDQQQVAKSSITPHKHTHLDLFKILENSAHLQGPKSRPLDIPENERTKIVLSAIYPKGIPNHTQIELEIFKKNTTWFICKCEQLYKASSRNRKTFIAKNKKWLSSTSNLQLHETLHQINYKSRENQSLQEEPAMSFIKIIPSASEEVRPSLDVPSTSRSNQHDNVSDRSQRRIRKSLEQQLENYSSDSLIKVFSKIVVDKTGNKLEKAAASDFEFVVQECLKSSTASTKIAKLIRSSQKTDEPYTPNEALCLIIDRKLSVEDYISIREGAKSRGSNIYPPYYKIQMVKKLCYPDVDIQISEREATVPLFDLVMHTFRRIIDVCDQKVLEYCEQRKIDTLHCVFEASWGFDGTTGQSAYKQSFSDGDDDEHCLFATTYIPLRIKTNDGYVLWINPNPQSFRFCRPIRIQYKPETTQLILNEKTRVEEEIKNLSPIFAENSSGKTVIGDPKLYLTIIDGKVFNAITNTTSQLRCACCGATCSEFKNLDLISKKSVNQEALRHGLSPLHAWIRIFEFLLHLGYKNHPAVQKWRVAKTSPESKIVEERKKQIQDEIRQKMGLLVDVVRPNSGTTNDGNTARTALSDSNRLTFANILGIEEWLVNDLHTILVALSCGLEIDSKKFQEFCNGVATKYVRKYGWYNMSVTIHKILMHGAEIIDSISLPIGMLSEQAGESRNKFWRYDSEHHTRKFNRKTTVLDLIHRALESSDPLLSSLSIDKRQKNRKRSKIPEKVLILLKPTMDNVFIHGDPLLHSDDNDDINIVLSSEEVFVDCDNDDIDKI